MDGFNSPLKKELIFSFSQFVFPIELTNILAAPVISETTYPIQQLSRGVVPTMYLKQGAISNVDPQVEMIRVITDIASMSELYNQNSQFKNIELILIQIENESDFKIIS